MTADHCLHSRSVGNMDLKKRKGQEQSERSDQPRPRVLFVDDERMVLEGLRDSLRRYPFDIESADSAEKGFEILASKHIDVVVSDERMPSMSGSEFLALVCELHPETVRIILSGQESPATGFRAMYEGQVFRFVRKPCSAKELAAIILLGLSERQDA